MTEEEYKNKCEMLANLMYITVGNPTALMLRLESEIIEYQSSN